MTEPPPGEHSPAAPDRTLNLLGVAARYQVTVRTVRNWQRLPGFPTTGENEAIDAWVREHRPHQWAAAHGEPPPEPDTQVPDHALPVATLARYLGVNRDALWKALARDPKAPGPRGHDHRGAPLYLYRSIRTWWPTRRRVGQRGPDHTSSGGRGGDTQGG